MEIETFELERIQSMYENRVEYNLTESGLHPYTLRELLTSGEIDDLKDIRLGYGQTNGAPELRDIISTLYSGANRNNILVTNGSAQANFINIWSNLQPGDELILMLPNYMQIWGLARSQNVIVKPFHLREDLQWAPDMAELNELVTEKTRMISLCNPNNPTGAVLSPGHMEEIVKLARKADAWIYCDEIYRGAELDNHETPSFFGMYDKVIVSGGLSKAYGLPGLRMGWLAGPADMIARAWSFNDYLTISTGILSQMIAARVLEPEMRNRVLERNRSMLKKNIGKVQAWINKHGNLFRMVAPAAGGMAFVRYSMDINSRELADRLRIEKNVFVMDGDCFGMDHFIRIGFGAPGNYLLAGLNRIDEFLSEII